MLKLGESIGNAPYIRGNESLNELLVIKIWGRSVNSEQDDKYQTKLHEITINLINRCSRIWSYKIMNTKCRNMKVGDATNNHR